MSNERIGFPLAPKDKNGMQGVADGYLRKCLIQGVRIGIENDLKSGLNSVERMLNILNRINYTTHMVGLDKDLGYVLARNRFVSDNVALFDRGKNAVYVQNKKLPLSVINFNIPFYNSRVEVQIVGGLTQRSGDLSKVYARVLDKQEYTQLLADISETSPLVFETFNKLFYSR